MAKKRKDKFQFDMDFQYGVLKYIITDKAGHKALDLVEDSYFALLEHQVICFSLKKHFKSKKRVGSKPIIKENIRKLYQTKKYANALTTQDKSMISKTLNDLYKGTVADGDTILDECIKFSRYVETKHVLEGADVDNYEEYESLVRNLQKAINTGDQFEDNKGIWLIKDAKLRHINRQIQDPTFPTPWSQFNSFLNNGGYTRHSLLTLLGPAKRFKTGALVNLARGYMRLKKKVLYIDLENGDQAIATRAEQSMMKKSNSEIYSGLFDSQTQKLFRRYNRLGAELVIKRFPAYTTNFMTIQSYIDEIYREYGVKFDVAIIDYLDLLGANSGQKDETQRISDVYIDAKNFLEYNDFETGWTGSHINREGGKNEAKKYKAEHIAKAIDKVRHADGIYGLNQSDDEKEAGVLRIEIVDHRQGIESGRALFKVDKGMQRMDEFNKAEIIAYNEQAEDGEEEQTHTRTIKNDFGG